MPVVKSMHSTGNVAELSMTGTTPGAGSKLCE